MIEDTPEGEGRQLLENLLHEVELTGSLFPALETVRCFPSYMCSMVFIALFLVAAGVCLYFFYTQKGRSKLSGFSTRFFVTRHLSEKIACSRFASGMYLALSSGLDVDQSLEMVARLVDHPIISEKITLMQKNLQKESSISNSNNIPRLSGSCI